MSECSHPKMYMVQSTEGNVWCCKDCKYTKFADKTDSTSAPWWFKKLVAAETAWFAAKRKEQGFYETDIHHDFKNTGIPDESQHDRLTIGEKLNLFGIVQEPGDSMESNRMAREVVTAARTGGPLPKLGTFMRDPENPRPVVDEEFGA